ncbi:MAG TPA: TetR-like C-terminal domain-containing protein, partial [Rhodocyclaceae bacterium]|nr:TetR-like C-terminal domain-containing protein [Rhodocyclaceae bacterium]
RFAFLPGLLAHMIENRAVFRTVIGRRSGHVVERRFRAMVVQLLEDDLAGQSPGESSPDIHARFIAGGWVDLMVWWVDTANPPPIGVLELQLRELAVRVVGGGGESLQSLAGGASAEAVLRYHQDFGQHTATKRTKSDC